MLIHAALLAAVHAHPAEEVTPTLPEPPAPEKELSEGEMLYVQDRPACVRVKVFPAMVSIPVRELAPVFCAAEYVTVPLPVMLPDDVMVIQPALLAAVHAHPVPAVTLTLPDPPEAGTDALTGEMA